VTSKPPVDPSARRRRRPNHGSRTKTTAATSLDFYHHLQELERATSLKKADSVTPGRTTMAESGIIHIPPLDLTFLHNDNNPCSGDSGANPVPSSAVSEFSNISEIPLTGRSEISVISRDNENHNNHHAIIVEQNPELANDLKLWSARKSWDSDRVHVDGMMIPEYTQDSEDWDKQSSLWSVSDSDSDVEYDSDTSVWDDADDEELAELYKKPNKSALDWFCDVPSPVYVFHKPPVYPREQYVF